MCQILGTSLAVFGQLDPLEVFESSNLLLHKTSPKEDEKEGKDHVWLFELLS